MFVMNLTTVDFKAVSNAGEVDMDLTMVAGKTYMFVCDQDCYITQAAVNPAAAKADGSWFVAKGVNFLIAGKAGVKLSVLGSAAGGSAFAGECTLA
jgi:hypothetical protein